jgi:hypothetical protein
MIAIVLVIALFVAVPQQGSSTESQATMQQHIQDDYEQHRQAAMRINELAGRIHSEADASAFVSEIAGSSALSISGTNT